MKRRGASRKHEFSDYGWFVAGFVLVLVLYIIVKPVSTPVGEAFEYAESVSSSQNTLTRSLEGRIEGFHKKIFTKYLSNDIDSQKQLIEDLYADSGLRLNLENKIDSLLLDNDFLSANDYINSDNTVNVIIFIDTPLEKNNHFTLEKELTLIDAVAGPIKKSGLAWARDSSRVKKVVLDYTVQLDVPTPRSIGGDLLNTDVIKAKNAHSQGLTGRGVKIAILDTGVDKNHPDIVGRVVLEKSFILGESPADGHGHGTHVATTAAGNGAASNGKYVGVAPEAEIINGKVLSNSGGGQLSGIIQGMQWAVNNDADIISMSLGGGSGRVLNDPLADAANAVVDHGIVLVAAAGNSGH